MPTLWVAWNIENRIVLFLSFIHVLLLLLRPPWFILFQRAGSSNRSIHHRIFVLCFAFSSVTHEALQVGLSTLRIKTFGILSLLLAHKTMPLGPATLISSDWKSFPFVCLGGLRDKRWCRDPPKELWQPEEMPVRREYTSSTLPQRLLGNKNCGGFRQLWRARTHTQLADGGIYRQTTKTTCRWRKTIHDSHDWRPTKNNPLKFVLSLST